MRLVVLTTVLIGLFVSPLRAQGSPEPEEGPLLVFLDCPRWRCDFDYLREEIGFVRYVRNRQDADVHVLVTTQGAGGGGTVYTLEFLGRDAFAGSDATLRYSASAVATEAERRLGFARTLKIGLVPYVAGSPVAQRLRISYEPAEGEGRAAAVAPSDDPWNSWVFDINLGGSMSGQASRKAFSYRGSASAERITEAWKTELEVSADVDEQTIETEERTAEVSRHTYEVEGLLVRALGGHWSIGAQAAMVSSPFQNRDIEVRVAPAIEYSVFPYGVATRREFVFRYAIGPRLLNYNDTTIYNKLQQTLLQHSLVAAFEMTETWGEASVSLEGRQYLHDLSRSRLTFEGNLEFRLFGGFSLEVGGEVALIHDQIYLRKGDATLEDVLLRRRQLATGYEYGLRIGFGYSFGSIFSAVVNPRFGGGRRDFD